MQEIPIRSFAVSVVVLRPNGLRRDVLLLRRTRSLAGEWFQVTGAIEPGETAWQAALREVEEETGLALEQLYSADICEQFYEADRDAISLLPVFVGFARQEAEVRLNAEHSEARWVSFAEASGMVPFAGQRNVLRHIESEFVAREPNRWLLVYPEG
ncbi:NUDIX domain-containing protein [Inquilinus sp. NPDC058860]|uniref:NUDIX domain-containing protein n=1 Tax=Inquilinus sp. NPDC058860 TaxID=3346652 RepID=UPI00369FA191